MFTDPRDRLLKEAEKLLLESNEIIDKLKADNERLRTELMEQSMKNWVDSLVRQEEFRGVPLV